MLIIRLFSTTPHTTNVTTDRVLGDPPRPIEITSRVVKVRYRVWGIVIIICYQQHFRAFYVTYNKSGYMKIQQQMYLSYIRYYHSSLHRAILAVIYDQLSSNSAVYNQQLLPLMVKLDGSPAEMRNVPVVQPRNDGSKLCDVQLSQWTAHHQQFSEHSDRCRECCL